MKNLDDHNRRPLNYQSKKKHSSKYSDDPEKIARKVAVHFTRLDSNDVMRNAYLIKMYTRYGHFLSSAVRLLLPQGTVHVLATVAGAAGTEVSGSERVLVVDGGLATELERRGHSIAVSLLVCASALE